MSDDIGKTIRILRQLKNMSQRELAQAVGLSYVAMNKIEKGKLGLSLAKTRHIARFFEMSVSQFYALVERYEQDPNVIFKKVVGGN